MHTFKKLKAAREHLVLLPGLKSYKDFDIAIEIGYHEKLGTPLSLKELLSIEVCSSASVRRHLKKLINDGFVVKSTKPGNLRVAQYTLSRLGHDRFQMCYQQLLRVLSDLE